MSLILPLLLGITPVDTAQIEKHYQLSSVEVTAHIKQQGELFEQPASGTTFSLSQIENRNISDQKDLSLATPNLFIPDYGSKMTSSIYVRGIGARMEQPSMGLYIDNVSILNKNNYDFDFYDIKRIEILRGPQSTLYGRNTIGGIINIFTLSPFDFQGFRGKVSYATGNTVDAKLSFYKKENDRFAWSLAAAHHSSDGFFINEYNGSKSDKILSDGLRSKMQWKLSDNLLIDNTLSINYVTQNGFAYAHYDPETKILSSINHNDPSNYDRISVINGTTIRYITDKYQLSSVTSYQFLDDKMIMDQDFTPASIFTLEQSQSEHVFTQELVIRSNDTGSKWHWLTGAYGFFRHNKTTAPVTFKKEGIDQLILGNANNNIHKFFPDDDLLISEDSFVISSNFTLPSYGLALFHQSTFDISRWKLSAGLRLDYEHTRMDYNNNSMFHYMFTFVDDDFKPFPTLMDGVEKQSFLAFVPKISALYSFNAGNIYATVTRGYKAGGMNTQIFSDLLQVKMMNDLMSELGVQLTGNSPQYDKASATKYKPEYSWNFEAGTHINLLNNKVTVETSVFYILCRDQQLTVFPPGQSTGRLMTNAGRSRSFGTELALSYAEKSFRLDASYGFTNAKFVRYQDGENNFQGNYVPYVPLNTIYLSGEYRFNIKNSPLSRITLRADWRGAGKIYWNESNSISQPFYGLAGADVSLSFKDFIVSFWGRNLTDKSYNTFYFKSMGNHFMQKGKPRLLGLTLKLTL